MAAIFSNTGLLLLMLTVLYSSAALTGSLVSGSTSTLIIENEISTVGNTLQVRCRSSDRNLGFQVLYPFNRAYSVTFTPSNRGTTVYTCFFETAGKRTTTIDVFKGYVYENPPCQCNGINYCVWKVDDNGFYYS